MSSVAKRGGGGVRPQNPLPEEVEKCLSEMKGMKRVRFRNMTRKLLRDPLLWLRIGHSTDELANERLSAVFDRLAPRLELCDANAENLRRRNRLCDESLRCEGRIEALKAFFSETNDKKDGDLRAVLFPYLPNAVREKVLAHEVSVTKQGVSGSGSVHRGIVTDLFNCQDGGWEGYIASITEKSAVYRFTSTSCVCAFPVCIGLTVEFCLSTRIPSTVADSSAKAIEYIPGTLPDGYAADYLQCLEDQAPSVCLDRIMNLPGPLRAILHEPDLHIPHMSKILAVLHCISSVANEYFSRVALKVGIHESSFLGSLPKTLCMQQSTPEAVATTRGSVVQFLSLVSVCIHTCPNIAYKMSSVIQGCARLANSFGEQFSLEGPNLGKAIIHACSVVRGAESLQEPLTEGSNDAPSLRDPLLWITHVFGKAVANSLRKYIPGTLFREDESGVIARRKLENIITSVAHTGSEDKTPTNILTKLHLPQSQSISSNEHGQLTQKMGIVIDLYPREGYIVLSSGNECHRRTQQVFKLGPATTTEVVSSIHLGDIVQFLVSSSAPETVERVVKIKQYCLKALDVTFASDYLAQNEDLVNLFKNEAAMKAILNASHVYTSPDVCAKLISTACSALSDLASSIKKKMLALLKSSSFILDVVQIAPEEVTKSMKVLEKYLEHFPNEVCVLVPALESMVDVLQKQDKPLELAAFVSFLSSSTCLLPHSVEIARQPWQTVPTLLTEEEWKAGAVANTDYLPCVKDCYTSVHEYGRTYFLLLRADCYGDLATSIRRLRDPTASNNKATDEAVVVYDATITAFSNYSAGHKLVYHFTIKTQPQSSENVSSDAPFLKAGNLLCLSVGGRFKDDIIWATINHVSRYIHFGENETKQCEVLVELCTESNTLSDEEAMLSLNNSGNVVALESPAYFRAYQPVLDALKQMDMEKIHFLPDLLNPGKEPQASLELINDNTLVTDLGGLKQEADGVPVVMTVGELREQLSDTEQYTDFCLPKFQRIAVERALSQALSLIQGPPGTGKSYIGMQLLRLFLSMKNSSGKLILENKPALVIAYKNRALDLFIKMCTSFCSLDRIVRIGHLSKDNEEELRCTLLNEKVMSGLDRNRTVELKAAMEHQYERVQMARIALVATVEMAGLNECLDHITPEWLQSLILHQGSVSAAYGVAARVRDDPERCLDLLQRARMGERDRQERQEIEETLSRAWSKWVEGIRWDPQDPVPGTSGSLKYDSDSELDSREYEEYYDTLQKRNNAVETLTSVYADFEDGPVEVSNVWALSPDDRRRMIRAATRERYESAMDDLKDSIRQYNMIRELYEKRREEKAVEILKGAKVVAMTTTGAAINQRLLNQLEAPVVFVEEAAEILESNLLAVLTPHVKHMVLIGDQKQLKPTVVWNKLASDRYKFDVSLFERLIRNKYPHTLLLRQSRMHPSLVPLYGYHYQRGPITIRSADKTKDLVHPKCMGKKFLWWSYSGAYETRREKGYMNTHEIDMVVSLCCWLLCNRVESGKIAVLTPYRGQLEEIKKSLEDKANKYRNMSIALVDIDVYTVDEYQGHECDVVILSLVRSNTSGKIGFLKSPNRLVVGTSRQKCALYIVGSHTFLEKNSPVLWKTFLTQCKQTYPDSIGTDLPIVVGTSPVECQSSSELDERVQMALEVAANNVEGDDANDTELDSDPPSAGLQSAVGTLSPSVGAQESGPSTPTSIRALSGPSTPATVRSQSAVSTPATVRAQSAVSTPASVWSQSAVSTPASRSARSKSVDSTPPSAPFRARFESTPAIENTQNVVSSSSPSHQLHSLSQLTEPQLSGSACRQQSSPPTLDPTLMAGDTPVLGEIDEPVSSSTTTWDFRQCTLSLKDTEAATNWKFIGRQLGLSDGDVEAIDKNYSSDMKEKFYQMMVKWRSVKGEKATRERLIEALKKEKQNQIAEELEKEEVGC